jgi:lipoate-protein ligase A
VVGELNAIEQILYDEAIKEINHPDWIGMIDLPESDRPTLTASQKFAAGMLQVNIAYDQVKQRIKQVWFSGDVFISPRRTLVDLEAALRDSHIDNVDTIVLSFFNQRHVDMLTLTPENILGLIKMAILPAEVVA